MTGLKVLYAQEAKEKRDWMEIPDRDKAGRLREVYWAKRVESEFGRKSFLNAKLHWRLDRQQVERGANFPGDEFACTVKILPEIEYGFEWIEVTEVFTIVSPKLIDGAMRVRNGIPNKSPVNFDEFKERVNKGRPSRVEQRKAADKVITQAERKLRKTSYQELAERYGYGTLVVGLPLWFAVPPEDPWRTENALDNFYVRTYLGLDELKRKILKRKTCPFKQIVVVWDTSPEALREWDQKRSREYRDVANTTFGDPIPFATGINSSFMDYLMESAAELGLAESEIPSISFKISIKTQKKKKARGLILFS